MISEASAIESVDNLLSLMISENVIIAVPVAEIFLKDAVKFLLDLGWMIVELDWRV